MKHGSRGPRDCKNNTGWVFFPKEWTTAPPPPNNMFFQEKHTLFCIFYKIFAIKTAPRPYVHVFGCGYGSHSGSKSQRRAVSKPVTLASSFQRLPSAAHGCNLQLTSLALGLSLLNELSELVDAITSKETLTFVPPTWNNVRKYLVFCFLPSYRVFFLCYTIPAGPAVPTHTSSLQSGHFTAVEGSSLIFLDVSLFHHHC